MFTLSPTSALYQQQMVLSILLEEFLPDPSDFACHDKNNQKEQRIDEHARHRPEGRIIKQWHIDHAEYRKDCIYIGIVEENQQEYDKCHGDEISMEDPEGGVHKYNERHHSEGMYAIEGPYVDVEHYSEDHRQKYSHP